MPRGRPRKNADQSTVSAAAHGDGEFVSMAALLSKKPVMKWTEFWIVGDSPLITHAWSEKARREMLSKQVKATRTAREARDPETDFVNSLYDMGDGRYGFPVTGIKKCVLHSAHKDKGIAKTDVMSALYFFADMVSVRPAYAKAVCDMPLVTIYGSKPEMREDMVKIGKGLNKTASLAYRAQFRHWAIKLTCRFNAEVLLDEAFAFLLIRGGQDCGIGEWRNEKSGYFGSFHVASTEEQRAWEAFAKGKGPLPKAKPPQFEPPTLMAAE